MLKRDSAKTFRGGTNIFAIPLPEAGFALFAQSRLRPSLQGRVKIREDASVHGRAAMIAL